jgi:hypothetical protein
MLSLTQLYRYTPEIFLLSTATFKYKYRAALRRIGQEYSAKVTFSIFQSLKRMQVPVSGMGQHGQRLNTGTCFSVSSDDKLVLFLFSGIPTGDPAIVAFYDRRIYKKVTIEGIVPK